MIIVSHDSSGENECISLSVLSVARVTIAQWENESISLSVLSVARVMIAQWENECISLSVLSVARVMIVQWENGCISPSVLSLVKVQFPAMAEYFKECSLADHTPPTRPEPVWQKMAQAPLNDTAQPVDREEEGGCLTMDRQWLKKGHN